MFAGAWISQAIGVAAELGVADLVADGPLVVSELAARTGSEPASLYRLLRALASVGVFEEVDGQRFAMTPLALLLRSDVPGSQRSFATMMAAEFDAAWGRLLHSVRTGVPGFDVHYGQAFFDYMLANPARHRIYDEAMNGVHGAETEPVLDAYDFTACRRVVDIGGGNGLALETLLQRHVEVVGVLFDLPAVADRARASLATSSSSDRLQIEGGDFFAGVPAGADAYLLRHVVHDWPDREAVAILRRCREAAAPGARVLVIEMVVPPANQSGFGKWLDLMMLVVGGRERTAEEYRALYAAAGIEYRRIIPTACEVSIVEGVCPMA
jgi:hypothetical protein